MPDNLIRLKQLEKTELSGFIKSISSGEIGLTGPVGPVGASGINITGAIGTGVGPLGGTSGVIFQLSNGTTTAVMSLPLGSVPSGSNGQFQYKSGNFFVGANVYYEPNQLGINTSTPAFDLDVGGTNGLRAYYTGSSAKGQIEHEVGGSTLRLYNDAGSAKVRIGSSGNAFLNGGSLGVMIAAPTHTLHVNGSGYFNSGLGFANYSSIPTGSNSNGISGQMAYDTGFFYICVATNTWRRTAISSF